jgi:prolyl oligopeptidase
MKYPHSKKIAHIDEYFGTKIKDPYRWLEDLDSPETETWIDAQNKITFEYLSKIPFREKIRKRLTEIWDYPKYQQPFKAGSSYLFYKNDGLQNQAVLYILDEINGDPEIILDPNTFSDDQTVSLEDVTVSNDGRYIAYAISKSGSDWRELFVIDIKTRKHLEDHITGVKFFGGNWYKNGFLYNKYPVIEGENQLSASSIYSKIYYHKLGTRQEIDILIYEDTLNPYSYHGIWSDENDKFLFMYKSRPGVKGNALYFKKTLNCEEKFTPIIETMDDSNWTISNDDNILYIYTTKEAKNGKLVAVDLDNPEGEHRTILPETNEPISNIRIAGRKIIATYLKDVTDRTLVYNLDGKFLYEIEFPYKGTVTGFDGKLDDKIIFYTITTMIQPPEVFLFDTEKNTSTSFKKSEVKFNPGDYEEKQVFYNSKDGTEIPMFLLYKKGTKFDGKNPALMYSYGGFGNSMVPNFSVSRILLLDNGGIFAMPCIRGGSEYGEKWHEAGMLNRKQNVFDDFIAAAEYLCKEGYTSPEKLAITGRSNGGLLIGAVVNQKPDLFRAAVPEVGVMDMLRFHKFTIGASWVTEYGSSDDPAQFKYLLAYSPLHNIREGVNYPAIMVTTSDHDDRVVPSHSYKYIAELQEKYNGPNPVIIRIEKKAGHGYGRPTSKLIEQSTDFWSFIFYNMGITPEW